MHAPYQSDRESHLQKPNTTSAGHRGADSDEIIAAVAVPGDRGSVILARFDGWEPERSQLNSDEI